MRGRIRILSLALATTASGLVWTGSVTAQESDGPEIAPTRFATASGPFLRTAGEMVFADATIAAPDLAGRSFSRPLMDMASYREAKARAAGPATPSGPALLPLAAPKATGISFNGVDQPAACGGCAPPDTHGAVGPSHFFEITNQHVDIYRKSDQTRVLSVSLAAFFGYGAQPLFDPRVIWDEGAGRWVVTTDAFNESASVQRFFLAISQTADPLGAYFVYNADVDFNNNGSFFDFPMLGEDKSAALVTGNRFGPGGGTELFVFPKSTFYGGGAGNFTIFTGLIGTLAATDVIDNSAKAFLIAAPPASNRIRMYTLTKSNRIPPGAFPVLKGPANITVPAYALPPNAAQPAPCTTAADQLDTSDNRFANSSTQVGSWLYNVHSIADGGRAANKYYAIDTAAKTVVASDVFTATGTSFDFNPSITGNQAADLFITWSSTDPTTGKNAQVRFSGRRATDPPNIPAGKALFTSKKCLTGNFDPNFGHQRWGDYSAVSLDPENADRAWLVNETVKNASNWGTRIGRIGF